MPLPHPREQMSTKEHLSGSEPQGSPTHNARRPAHQPPNNEWRTSFNREATANPRAKRCRLQILHPPRNGSPDAFPAVAPTLARQEPRSPPAEARPDFVEDLSPGGGVATLERPWGAMHLALFLAMEGLDGRGEESSLKPPLPTRVPDPDRAAPPESGHWQGGTRGRGASRWTAHRRRSPAAAEKYVR